MISTQTFIKATTLGLAAIASFGITSPVLAANQIKWSIKHFEIDVSVDVSVAAIEDFAQTGNTSGLPLQFSSVPPELQEKLRTELNQPLSIDSISQIQPSPEVLLKLLLPKSTEEERKSALTLMAQKANGKTAIDFLKALPVDTLTPDNFLPSLNAYQGITSTDPTPIDLRTWKEEGPPANGNWVVSPDGTSVLQTINGFPTFFVSPDNFINTTIKGKFKVEEKIDDDFIGFVFGYQSPIAANSDKANKFNFLLFDWNQGLHHQCSQGFSLARVNGTISDYSNFCKHKDSKEFDLIATDFGKNKGWKDYTEYDFSLLYQTDRIKIDIDGQTIFDVSGEFQPGRFGFYNLSQRLVRYAGFTQQNIDTQPIQSVPEPSSALGLLGFGVFGVGSLLKRKRQQKVLNLVVND